MANRIIPKKSTVAGKAPATGDLEIGEIAINLTDRRLYAKDGSGAVVQIGGGAGTGDVNGPASATDKALARYDGVTGKLIQNSTVTLDDNGTMANINALLFDLDPTLPTTEGSVYWNEDVATLTVLLAGGDVKGDLLKNQYIYTKASSAITKGQAVMFTGAVGASGTPTGAPATGINDGSLIMGIAAHDIALNDFGFVQTLGTLRPVSTTAFSDGDILWYNPAVAGGLTATKPAAPNIKVQMAAVLAGGIGGGALLIRITAGSELGGTDSNVAITTPSQGQALVYNAATGIWENKALFDSNGNLTAPSFFASGTGALGLPVGTTAQRPGSPQTGWTRINTDRTTRPVMEFWDGTEWVILGWN